ncbi:SusC/RagA family TonB-linked outer membrane protein [Ancylomarina sp. 16SWW S1-10-2]|uniref:SusC/RagA family TonB-linked outer membrane protein n=1 Tax=Ancylomarina sp. 16SWW S1-10-2 TaxID=2499681 RepID=UPI0012ADDB49|nr:SusC/RagA family TonB-linked outer membrane protein [Ancylomarina sp. 16SWW S1-10-2]MRT93327.1 SusC/RagA family TonB-linked outer membrane protein [Ancylomarina sp. 16SWW S1-10-2]
MKKLIGLFAFLLLVGTQIVTAQSKEISGAVTSADDGLGMPGVSVVIKGTTVGASTDMDGRYSIEASASDVLVYSFVGMISQNVTIGSQTVINVVLETESIDMDEVVVTALGITRDKKSLGYAVTEVGGESISEGKESNIINSLSGKVAGVSIRQANTMGGSANIIIRGSTSISGNNQALFVVDGVPMDNSNTNTADQSSGWGGYDYGNAASDINPDDVESVSILKGAAASALYGSRAANGVVLITTKKGKKRKGIGVSINSGVTFSTINRETMPEYQYEYGAGYSQDWTFAGSNGLNGETVVNVNDDASWGPAFDPNMNVVHWDALDPTADNYGETRPWVAPNSKVYDFFETGVKLTNSIALTGGDEFGSFRLSYTNSDESGILPNSSIKKNSMSIKADYKLSEKLTATASANYVNTKGKGRFGTGYDDNNPMQGLAQWFETNLDFGRLKDTYETADGGQLTWNASSPTDISPAYTNNPYWVRYKNYEDDERNRLFGHVALDYKLNDMFSITYRTSIDFYQERQNERIAEGSNAQSYFSTYDRTFSEWNSDLMLKFNKTVNDFSLSALLGVNYLDRNIQSIFGETSGGLIVPGLYTVSNSTVAVSPVESLSEKNTKSGYGSFSVGYQNFAYLEASFRVDQSSTLPTDNNTYFYPAVSGSLILSELDFMKDLSFLSFAKLRGNYAEVGNDTNPYNISSAYYQYTNWGDKANFSVSSTLKNPDLKSERTESVELGLEAKFLDNRFGFDFAVYQSKSYDQIMAVNVSKGSGYTSAYVNSGEIENKGIELGLNAHIIKTSDFNWDMNVNWAQNKNEVISLYDGVTNIPITSAWDVTLNATVGEAYGVLKGTDFNYVDGKKVVDASTGYYTKTADDDKVIGNIQADWTGGITNTFSYKGISLRTLIDIQQGGDIYSVDRKYGLATGLYKETAGLNSKGNPKRDAVSDGGGILHANAVYADGTQNTTFASASGWGGDQYYGRTPTARYIYDASYVKLREVTLSYTLPKSILSKTFLNKAVISAVGRNLWIIHKNTPGFDPETGLSSGNKQGIANASYPTTRTYGFNVSLGF